MKALSDKIKRLTRIVRVLGIRYTMKYSRKIILPGFEGISLWEILFFFVWSIRKGLISTRASSLAFHFFLALIPFGLVLVLSTAYVPFFDLKTDIIPILSSFVPPGVVDYLLSGIQDMENSKVSSVISIGFFAAIYLNSNGFKEMIQAFNSSKIQFKKRSWLSTRLVSFGLVFGFLILIIGMFLFIVWERKLLLYMADNIQFVKTYYDTIFYIFSFLIAGLAIYFSIAFLYYVGPSKQKTFKTFKFFSAGATLSTGLVILIFLSYSFYVKNFATYNAFYGSAGTIMIVLLWIYLNSFALLIGFELNASIHGAIMNKKLQTVADLEKQFVKQSESLES